MFYWSMKPNPFGKDVYLSHADDLDGHIIYRLFLPVNNVTGSWENITALIWFRQGEFDY
jgi:hypothetical protein